jgi:hypothetical protein
MEDSAPLVQTLFRPDSWLSIRNTQAQENAAKRRVPPAVKAKESGEDTQLAWIGNSFVYYNNLQKMLAAMLAKNSSVVLTQKDLLVGGQGLYGHSLDAKCKDLLQANR